MPKRILKAQVVSRKMDKTAVVKVKRTHSHELYGKTVTTSKKYSAHDEHNRYNVNDFVLIRESRPLSKTKHWEIIGFQDGSSQ